MRGLFRVNFRRPAPRLAVALAATAALGCAAHAETLADALALAYQSNPTLQSQRALQRQLDETYVIAEAGLRPTLNATANAGFSQGADNLGRPVDRNFGQTQLTASQPLYTGGRVSSAVRAADATVRAGRENLRAQEQTVLQSVVQAYQDVLRDQRIVAIRQSNLALLQTQLDETRARFDVGQLTNTEVAQSEAQLASARALLANAQAQLQISRANYTAAVGQNPGELVAPPPLPGLPATVDEGFSAAEEANPLLRRAQITETASRARIAQVRAQTRPTLSVQGSVGYSGQISPFDPNDYARTLSAQAIVTQPLFTGGVISSNIRSATEQNNSDRVQIEASRRQVVQQVSQAWNQMIAARASVLANQEQVRAAQIAVNGFQEQYRVGIATNLDVLIAQQTFQNAEVALAQAVRDEYVAQANLLNAMGRLDARSLLSDQALYDPAANFERVKNKGALPWEPLIHALDGVAAPAVGGPRPLPPGPAAGGGASLKPADTRQADAAFSTTTPTQPVAPLP
jgi:outer membrane protein